MEHTIGPIQILSSLFEALQEHTHRLEREKTISRIWNQDHSVWGIDEAQSLDRLGWLRLPDTMPREIPKLTRFSEQILNEGFTHIALLGMGGSSLAAQVLANVFGEQPGFPKPTVLNSIMPRNIVDARNSIDITKTLFIIASKSGDTIETLSLYKYFHQVLISNPEIPQPGSHFIAITDPETPLEYLARRDNYRRIFLNPPGIGGRYSALSLFGLIPAILTGLNIQQLLNRATDMQAQCSPNVEISLNPAAVLGAFMATHNEFKTNKLTLITSPSLTTFGSWVEQLVAESTGKQGRGLVPIIAEPRFNATAYGLDRFFIYLRLDNDDNKETDKSFKSIQENNKPSIQLNLKDSYDIGAQFYLWEMAVTITAALQGINPFDEPDVTAAKEQTSSILQTFSNTGAFPELEFDSASSRIISQAIQGDYLAILAYLPETPETYRVLTSLREQITKLYHIPTSLAYGPKYLHSLGQLHKGGSGEPIFLLLSTDLYEDIVIPDTGLTFGNLITAQKLGDLQTLNALNRRIVRLQLPTDPSSQLDFLMQHLELS